MVHPGSRLWDSALVIDLSQLPSASPAGSYHLNHSDSILPSGCNRGFVITAHPGHTRQQAASILLPDAVNPKMCTSPPSRTFRRLASSGAPIMKSRTAMLAFG